jgi:hypothetical protein
MMNSRPSGEYRVIGIAPCCVSQCISSGIAKEIHMLEVATAGACLLLFFEQFLISFVGHRTYKGARHKGYLTLTERVAIFAGVQMRLRET